MLSSLIPSGLASVTWAGTVGRGGYRRGAAGSAGAAVQAGPWQLHPRGSSKALLAFVLPAARADQVSPRNNLLLQRVVAIIRPES